MGEYTEPNPEDWSEYGLDAAPAGDAATDSAGAATERGDAG